MIQDGSQESKKRVSEVDDKPYLPWERVVEEKFCPLNEKNGKKIINCLLGHVHIANVILIQNGKVASM